MDADQRPPGFATPAPSKPVWYHSKAYAHFDFPLSAKRAEAYVTDKNTIKVHSFYPFLAFDIKVRRYKFDGKRGVSSVKSRPIRVASHVDGYIFSYYAYILCEYYENFISNLQINSSVLAYRKGLGSNIDFAKAAFDEVDRRGTCVALAMDLKSFFDNIDHHNLKHQWCSVIGEEKLPADHFAVFRAITKYALVEREECYNVLGIDKKKPRTPLCSAKDFREKIRQGGLINTNSNCFGIPQGSAISAILSNIFLLGFDADMVDVSNKISGYYRRYCDDILWIVDIDQKDMVIESVQLSLKKFGDNLRVNDEKTVVSRFIDGRLIDGYLPLQYLGFTYDGVSRRVRSQTLSKFWRKAIYAIRAAKRRAKKSADSPKVFRRKIYRRFTHLGKRNFLTYARRANETFGDGCVGKQLRRHWDRIHREITDRPL